MLPPLESSSAWPEDAPPPGIHMDVNAFAACTRVRAVAAQYRTTRNYKDPAFLGPRIGDKVLISLLIMTLYLGIGNDFSNDNYINMAAVLFMWCVLPAFGAASYVPSLVLGESGWWCGCAGMAGTRGAVCGVANRCTPESQRRARQRASAVRCHADPFHTLPRRLSYAASRRARSVCARAGRRHVPRHHVPLRQDV